MSSEERISNAYVKIDSAYAEEIEGAFNLVGLKKGRSNQKVIDLVTNCIMLAIKPTEKVKNNFRYSLDSLSNMFKDAAKKASAVAKNLESGKVGALKRFQEEYENEIKNALELSKAFGIEVPPVKTVK